MSQTASFKVLHPVFNIIVSLVLFLVSFFVLHSIFSGAFKMHQLGLILIPVSFVISYFITRSITKSDAKISITDNLISIELYNELFNYSYLKTLDRAEIHGFEIQKNNLFHRLVLYRERKSPIVLTLIDSIDEEIELLATLKPNLRHIGKSAPLSSATYLAAFLKILASLMLFVLINWVVYLGINWVFYYFNQDLLFNPSLFWLALPIGLLLLFNKLYYQLNFRLIGRDLSWILCSFVCVGIIFTFPEIGFSLIHKPVKVNDLTESIKHPDIRFFTTEKLTIDSTLIGYKSHISGSSKSSYHHVWHYFALPVIRASGTVPVSHSVWIANGYSQKISKDLSAVAKEKARTDYMNTVVQIFKSKTKKKARFYEVRHSQHQRSFRNEAYFQTAASTRHLLEPTLILQAHDETFENYRMNQIKSLQKGIAISLTAVMLFSLIIAYYR